MIVLFLLTVWSVITMIVFMASCKVVDVRRDPWNDRMMMRFCMFINSLVWPLSLPFYYMTGFWED